MPALQGIPPGRLTRQPQYAAPIDWSNPLTRGLVVCAMPVGGRFFDAVTRQMSIASGEQKLAATIDGNAAPARRIVNPGASSYFPNPTGADVITGAWTVFAECSPEVNGTTSVIYASTEGNIGNGFSVGVDDANIQYNSLCLNSSYTPSNKTSGQILGADAERYVHRVAWSWNTTEALFFAKRVRDTPVAFTTAPVADSGRRSYLLTSVAGQGGQGGAALILVYNRALSLAEYQALYDNPWQLFAPLPRRIWVPSAAGGGTFFNPLSGRGGAAAQPLRHN